jgi:chitodextrinase
VWAIVATGFNYTTTTEGPLLMFAFDRRVEYTITLGVLDDDTPDGTTDQVRVVVDMRQIKTNPPTVGWTLPVSPAEGELATFTATAQDPFPAGSGLQQAFLFEWEFGDGGRATGATVSHSFAARETPYTVRLTVTDEDDDKTVLTGNVTVKNLPPVIASVRPIDVKAGSKGTTDISATDLTEGAITISLGEGSPKWVSIEGTKLVAKPKSDTVVGTYLVTVKVRDSMGAETDTFVPIVVSSEEGGLVARPVSWGPFLAIVIVVLILFIIIALLIARRARAATPPPPPPSPREEEVPGSYPYDTEPVVTRRREQARAAVEPERVRVEVEDEAPPPPPPTAEELYGERARVAPASRPPPAPHPPPHPPPPQAPFAGAGGFELEMEAEAPAPAPPPAQEVKIWRPPAQVREKPIVVQERVVPAPPPPPREWTAPKPATGDSKYKMHGPVPGEKKRYRGAGPPK